MKIAKLVLGILSIVLSVMVLFQSCAAGMVDALEATGGTGGAAGLFVGILMLTGGIVNIATRNSKGGAIACSVIFLLGGLMGLALHGVFTDLQIWGGYCIIVAVVNIVSIKTQFKQK